MRLAQRLSRRRREGKKGGTREVEGRNRLKLRMILLKLDERVISSEEEVEWSRVR